MKKEELNKIIESLESSNSVDDAHLAIYQYGGGPDESYAKANKEGLELLAVQLLKASRDFDEIVNDDEKNIILLDYEEDWLKGDVFIHYVEPVDKAGKPLKRKNEAYTEKFSDQLVPLGCFGIILIIVISTIVGLVSIFNWIF